MFLQHGIFAGIILFHPRVFHCAFEVENVVWIHLKKLEILIDCVPHIIFDCGLHIPVPLGVEVGVSHKIGLGLGCLRRIGRVCSCCACEKRQGKMACFR